MAKIAYEEFKKVLDFMPFEPEFELYVKNTDNTYVLNQY